MDPVTLLRELAAMGVGGGVMYAIAKASGLSDPGTRSRLVDSILYGGKAGGAIQRSYRRLQQHDWDGAIEAANEAIAASPSAWKAYLNRGVAWLSLGALEAASADFDSAAALAPSDYRPRMNAATANLRRGRLDLALMDADRALRLKRLEQTLFVRAEVLFAMERYEEARADYAGALRYNPGRCDLRDRVTLCQARLEPGR